MDEIIYKSLINEISEEEKKMLSDWLEESEDNRRLYEGIRSYWNHPGRDTEGIKKEVWSNIRSGLAKKKPAHTPIRVTSGSNGLKYFKIAATVLLLMVSIWVADRIAGIRSNLADNTGQVELVEKVNDFGQLKLKLPDGSYVELNAASKLIFPEKFDNEKREVELIGEAFFEISEDLSRPFIIRSGNVRTTVLGTSFNIRAYPDEKDVKIAVKTGRVGVNVVDENETYRLKELRLTPNEMAIYQKDKRVATKIASFDEMEVFGWKDGVIYFKNANMYQVISKLETWYGVEIDVYKSFDPQNDFTGYYENQSLESVLKGLGYVFDFSYEINNKVITIK